MAIRVLAISGSLRAASSNSAALRAAAMLAPPGMDIVFATAPGDLPHYNPDLDGDPCPDKVMELRHQIGQCDGLLISAPEYAHGVAGSFKNLLDWLVSSVEFPGKPIALINTAPRATHAQAQLHEILTTMSARLIEQASITLPLLGRPLTDTEIAADPTLSALLRASLADLSRCLL